MITRTQIQLRLSAAIKRSGMTQTAIAEELNISSTQICCYTKGRKLPSLETFANLCKILDIDTNYILCQE